MMPRVVFPTPDVLRPVQSSRFFFIFGSFTYISSQNYEIIYLSLDPALLHRSPSVELILPLTSRGQKTLCTKSERVTDCNYRTSNRFEFRPQFIYIYIYIYATTAPNPFSCANGISETPPLGIIRSSSSSLFYHRHRHYSCAWISANTYARPNRNPKTV